MWISKEALKSLIKDQAFAYNQAIKVLEAHVETLKAQNTEMHDRIMALNYQEFAIGRVGIDPHREAVIRKPGEDPDEHLIGTVVHDEEVVGRG